MKQTAVELLIEQLTAIGQLEIPKGSNAVTSIIEQAKTMEKEQMGKIFKQAQKCAVKADGVYFKYESFEKYYQETFKSE